MDPTYLLTKRFSQNLLMRQDFPEAGGPMDMTLIRMGFYMRRASL